MVDAPLRTYIRYPENNEFVNEAYEEMFKYAKERPEEYWREQAEKITWFKKPEKILDDSTPPLYKWYPDGLTNICYNAIDRHVENGLGAQTAFLFDSAYTHIQLSFSYAEVQQQVGRLASVLKKQFGVGKGDRVLIYMPMVPEGVFAMLACARIGAIHSVVFGGFAANELANRLDDSQPKLIITASCGVEPNKVIHYVPIIDQACEMSHKALPRLILQRTEKYVETNLKEGLYTDYKAAYDAEPEVAECEQVESTHPLYILYTSGTTGAPKGIVRDTGGTAVALNWVVEHVFDIQQGEIMFSASDIGWVVGHSFIVYGPLLRGATSLIYEGKPITPDAGAFWRIVEQYKVKTLYAAPTAVRIIKKEDYEGALVKKYDVSSLKNFLLVGERCDPDTIFWVHKTLPNVKINDTWWQTETGWPISANFLKLSTFKTVFPTLPGAVTKPAPGYQVAIMDDGHNLITEANKLGNVVIKLPLPPSFMLTLWGNDAAFIKKYLSDNPGYYTTGDAGTFDEQGYFHIMTRVDDVINTAGHRISTGRLEEVVNSHDSVVESAVVARLDEIRGECPFAFVIVKGELSEQIFSDKALADKIAKEINGKVRAEVGAFCSLDGVVFVNKLPKTRSGKILRGTVRKILNKHQYVFPATIEDPTVLEDLKEKVEQVYAERKLEAIPEPTV
jgi:propionyl-CoA synthetase